MERVRYPCESLLRKDMPRGRRMSSKGVMMCPGSGGEITAEYGA
jgi:hypothetical protein